MMVIYFVFKMVFSKNNYFSTLRQNNQFFCVQHWQKIAYYWPIIIINLCACLVPIHYLSSLGQETFHPAEFAPCSTIYNFVFKCEIDCPSTVKSLRHQTCLAVNH